MLYKLMIAAIFFILFIYLPNVNQETAQPTATYEKSTDTCSKSWHNSSLPSCSDRYFKKKQDTSNQKLHHPEHSMHKY